MKIKSQRDFAAGLLFVVVGVACAWRSIDRLVAVGAPAGTGYFPLGLGVLLAVLGAMVLFKALALESVGGDPIGRIGWRPLTATLGAVVFFGVALPHLGWFITAPGTVALVCHATPGRNWRRVAALGVATTAVGGVLLTFWPGLGLPLWPRAAGH